MTPGVDFIDELQRAIRESIPKPKMMILGFPSNPTAQCVELEFFERVVALAKEHGILVVHDLAYADICFDGWKAPSIMQVPDAREVAVDEQAPPAARISVVRQERIGRRRGEHDPGAAQKSNQDEQDDELLAIHFAEVFLLLTPASTTPEMATATGTAKILIHLTRV